MVPSTAPPSSATANAAPTASTETAPKIFIAAPPHTTTATSAATATAATGAGGNASGAPAPVGAPKDKPKGASDDPFGDSRK